jgi:benzoylformate decarboxylase
MRVTGAQALVRMLAAAGVRYLFGNPGTTELPLMDALAEEELRQVSPRVEYILGLQEVPVVAMADGLAQASRRPAVVNVHASCGLGNALGMLYNAYRAGTPLILTAGQSDRRLRFEEPILWSRMVDVARPWTKWAYEVERVEELPVALRRALQTAATPPSGPVFLSLPMDVQMETAELDLSVPAPLDARIRPPLQAVEQAARLLSTATRPAILAGCRVVEHGAVDELVAVAELLAAPVMSESATTHGRVSFPCGHPLSSPPLPLWSPDVRARLEPFDAVLVVGMDLLRQYVYYDPPCPIPPHVRLVHLDDDPWQIGKNYPAAVGVWSHLKTGLAELGQALRHAMSEEGRQRAEQRLQDLARQRAQEQHKLRSAIASQQDVRPMTPLALMGAVADVLSADAAVVEEAVTTTGFVLERLGALRDPAGYFAHRGWALGWGLGCALGVKLAWPQRPVVALLGEGAALYGIQGLWTAARYRIPVTFVICNNAQYRILKIGSRQLGLPAAAQERFVGQDLTDPEVDFVALSESMGVPAQRVGAPEELRCRLAEALRSDGPRLLEVPIQRG